MRSSSLRSLSRLAVLALLSLGLGASPALGWDDHTLMARVALAEMPEIKASYPVQVESLESFLLAEGPALVELLQQQESWAQAKVPNYPPLPESLAFQAQGEAAELQRRLLEALRLAPDLHLALYRKATAGERPIAENTLHWSKITTLRDPGAAGRATFVRLLPGENVPPLDVVAAACDEPDYGFDLGVWADNKTEWGPRYGMGTQPFGDRTKEYSSQAPLHMGFYHEAGIVYKLAGFLGRTYPELRIHQFQVLARHAFATGHDYWGWRFTGWALHYVQDLAMPYHARVLPGVSVPRMLFINMLSVIGMPGPADNALRLVSNRHMTLEHVVREELEDLQATGAGAHPFLEALADSSTDSRYGDFEDSYPRHTLTAETLERADLTDKVLENNVPTRFVSDTAYIVDETERDLNVLLALRESMPQGEAPLVQAFTPLLRSFGAHSRVFVRTIRQGMPAPRPPAEAPLSPPR